MRMSVDNKYPFLSSEELAMWNMSAWSDENLTTIQVAPATGAGFFLTLVNFYYGLIYVVGMCGNALVLYVVCRYSKMHTVTNFFILSLAVADLCFLINLPFLMVTTYVGHWIFGDLYCKIYYSMTTVNQFASSFFLMVMSADRYFAVCHPIRSNKYRTAKAAVVVCMVIWLASIVLMFPVFAYAGVSEGTPCAIHWPGAKDGMQAFTLYCFLLGFAFPLVLILAFYTMVLQKLKTLDQKSSVTKSETRKRSHRRVTVVVLAVVTAYLICWLPYWIFQLVLVFAFNDQSSEGDSFAAAESLAPPDLSPELAESLAHSVHPIVFIMSFLQSLAYTNSAVNPVLYAMLSENFKKSFLTACCGKRLDFDRSALPDPSVYRPNRGASFKKREPIEDDDGDDSPDRDLILTDGKTDTTNFLKTPDMKNGKNLKGHLKIAQISFTNGTDEKEDAL